MSKIKFIFFIIFIIVGISLSSYTKTHGKIDMSVASKITPLVTKAVEGIHMPKYNIFITALIVLALFFVFLLILSKAISSLFSIGLGLAGGFLLLSSPKIALVLLVLGLVVSLTE